MASIGHNETAAVEAFDDDAATAVEKHAPGHVQLPLAPGSHPHNPASHDPDRPDISFPFQTTNTVEGGFTDEYRVTSKTGYITADLALRPVPSRYHKLPAVLADPEKAFRLKQVKLVTWYENDPEDPRNWKNAYKWYITFVCALSVVAIAFATAIIAGDFGGVMEEFQVSEVVVALSVSLMIIGFGIGPLILAPLSELHGRRPFWVVPFVIYIIFNIPCALAKNIGTLLVSRFLCGLFGSGPFALAGGAIADIWDNNERGFAVALFAAAPYGGPVLGPIVGGFIGETVGWRWIFWVNMMFAGVVACMCATIPETYAPAILLKRAKRLRAETGDPHITTEQELFRKSLKEIVVETAIRPFQMIATEPILTLMSMYASLIYGLLYAFFFSFPIVFSEGYGYNDGITGLMFCSVLIGVGLALFVTPRLERDYLRRAKEKGGHADPEDRLIGMMIGCWFIPIGMFIFGWTSPPTVMPGGGNWVGPCSAGIPFGFGMVVLYFSANAYIIDAFPGYVASALAAKIVIRSGLGAATPLFISAMFHNLGNGWAASVWGFISFALIPIPFCFYRYGKAIRGKSKRAV
ncbi:MFS general substrate transporter [Trametes versicolor FP-101664 SS1]|uniref:MFS general substrate transporter n=1 Tax=Trametes versicolor (strain FP-101664) TaxID=717944 RepID=R7S792_TRAVS|nr:MFS general substrate transporter [Trametes versicolor FP-101664 SS1]EIW51893.1 MFS general substrate transporter [Trametes versicolor FP-101664 SS1]